MLLRRKLVTKRLRWHLMMDVMFPIIMIWMEMKGEVVQLSASEAEL